MRPKPSRGFSSLCLYRFCFGATVTTRFVCERRCTRNIYQGTINVHGYFWARHMENSKTASRASQLVVRLLLVLGIIATTTTTPGTVVLGYDGSANAFHLLVLLLNLLRIRLGIGIEPRLTVLEGIHDLLFLLLVHLLAEALVFARTLGRRPHRMDVAIERVLRVDALLYLLVLVGKLLCFLGHLLDLLLGEPAFVVRDGDFLLFARALVLSTDVEDPIGVDFEGYLDLWLTPM